MNKDIILGDEVKDKILEGINKLSKAVLTTMGPNGNTVIIMDGHTPYITKDGVSVSNSVLLDDPIEHIGAQLLKEVAKRTVEQAGDGTTTSICLAHAFINKGFKLLQQGISYNEIKTALDQIEKDVIKELKSSAKQLNSKDIINVAKVSANGDEEIAELISKAYAHSHTVKVEESNQFEDKTEYVQGMKVLGSYFDKAFVNNFKKQAVEYNDVKLLVVKGKVNSISELKPFLEGEQTKPICIIADDYHASVISLIKENFNKGYLDIALLKSPGFAQHRKDLISDIISYTKAVHSIKSKNIYFTHVQSILATNNSILIQVENPEVEEKISNLKDLLNAESDSYQKELLEQRIENLEGKLSIIRVGGNSELEMKERKDRIDDAVLAVKSALAEGTVKGGGFALRNIQKNMLYTKTPILELSFCLLAPYETIGVKKISNKILDPAKVTRCAFENAISVAKTILHTKAIVIGQVRWK